MQALRAMGKMVLAGFVALFSTQSAVAVDLHARSTSASKQFTIYCEDVPLRARVTGFVEDIKSGVYETLGLATWGKIPIVVTLEGASGATTTRVQLIQTPEGPTIQVKVKIGGDPGAVHLEKHIVRAVLLDFMYRDRPHPVPGTLYAEAPWWVVGGIIETNRRKDREVESDLFERLVETNKLPLIEQLLAPRAEELGPTADAFDAACAMALVQLLLEQPDGRTRLAGLVRTWPDHYDNPVSALNRAFPNLGEGAASLQKWWTVNLAGFAALQRYRGLSPVQTEQQLNGLLQFDVTTDKAGTREHFSLRQFREFMKMPGARQAMKQQHLEAVKLGAQANALLAPIVQGYEQIFFLLARGKTQGIANRITQVETYRTTVLNRRGEIADFLNWFEATQLGTRSDAFDGYLQLARKIDRESGRTAAGTEIAQYLDLLQEEFEPIRPR